MTIDFSIITAVRNDLSALKRTYASLTEQTNQNFEWIVIDAASNDGTAAWLSNLQCFPERMYWISEVDKGISDAWNKGIQKAKGKQILILNAGDTYDFDLIEKFSAEVNEQKITCCHARLMSVQGDFLGILKANPSRLWRGMHVPHNWCSVPRSTYLELGMYRLIPHSMDFDWFYRYYRKYGKSGFKVIDVALGEYHLGGYSDVNYREGFIANEQIIKDNGGISFLSSLIRIIYILKHCYRSKKNI